MSVPPTSYMLRHYSIRIQAEPIRWLFEYIGVEYNEERIEFEDWNLRKHDIEWRELPVLVVDKKIQLHRSMTICFFLARKFKLGPEDHLEQARLEAIAESLNVLVDDLTKAVMGRINDNWGRVPEMIFDVRVNSVCTLLLIERNITAQGWIRSDEMTWCDIVVTAIIESMRVYIPTICELQPKLQKLIMKVKKVPSIHNWLLSGPPMKSYEKQF